MNFALRFASVMLFGTCFVSPALGQTPVPDFLIDLNQDGAIDSKDLLILIRKWGLEGIATPTPTLTVTHTPTPVPTSTSTLAPTLTPSSTPTHSPTSTDTTTQTPTQTPTRTDTPSPTETPTNPASISVSLPGPLINMIRIPAGSFLMGSTDTERGRNANEGPLHPVTIGYDFYLSETEVTQAQWEAVMGYNAATHMQNGTPRPNTYGVGADYPVYNVSWDDCQAFVAALLALGQGNFRLPSEAEWEYACRAGTTTRFYFGRSLDCADGCEDCEIDLPIIGRGKSSEPSSRGDLASFEPHQILPLFRYRSDYIWYCGNSGVSTHPVRQKRKNAFGLNDMAGNVYEWCQDTFQADYTGAPNDGSVWELPGQMNRVIRNGGFGDGAGGCRSARREGVSPLTQLNIIGFRLARDL